MLCYASEKLVYSEIQESHSVWTIQLQKKGNAVKEVFFFLIRNAFLSLHPSIHAAFFSIICRLRIHLLGWVSTMVSRGMGRRRKKNGGLSVQEGSLPVVGRGTLWRWSLAPALMEERIHMHFLKRGSGALGGGICKVQQGQQVVCRSTDQMSVVVQTPTVLGLIHYWSVTCHKVTTSEAPQMTVLLGRIASMTIITQHVASQHVWDLPWKAAYVLVEQDRRPSRCSCKRQKACRPHSQTPGSWREASAP